MCIATCSSGIAEETCSIMNLFGIVFVRSEQIERVSCLCPRGSGKCAGGSCADKDSLMLLLGFVHTAHF